ncbi:TIGR03086 family metal-binding protein [Streptomyces daliensis]|uniref:TIGR03086 family protein n=1 Tax=Streptomyces daliensis TaxID=299421 RepID=A0A8T4IKL8_9ACTN|nr:TIGR03086 family protein [Streptomyces daliensis]
MTAEVNAPAPKAPAPQDHRADPRPLYARTSARLAELIAAVPRERMVAPTPCEEFDVRALIAHLVEGMHGVALVAEGGTKGAAVSAAPADDGDAAAWAAEYEKASALALAAWEDDAKLDAPMTVPWGTVPGRAALAGFVMENVTHIWDLAQALDTEIGLDPGPGEFALAVARLAVGEERRGEGVPFGPVREVPEGADVYGQLAAWLGRRTDWAARNR